MALQGKQKEIEVGGDTFILQHPGIRKALQIQDDTRSEGGVSREALTRELLEHVVTLKDTDGMPKKITMDHFENYDSLKVFSEVIAEASKFVFR